MNLIIGPLPGIGPPSHRGGDDVVRFEAFSSCCSTYARVDFLPAALDGERSGRGTTNVDFNAPNSGINSGAVNPASLSRDDLQQRLGLL
jgi:hypothetical protein